MIRHKIFSNGDEYWYKNDHYHNDYGPAVLRAGGQERWYDREKNIHRENGPAEIFPDGEEVWCKNRKQHRIDGPAVIFTDGYEKWYQGNKFFGLNLPRRKNGPAMIKDNGDEEFFKNMVV